MLLSSKGHASPGRGAAEGSILTHFLQAPLQALCRVMLVTSTACDESVMNQLTAVRRAQLGEHLGVAFGLITEALRRASAAAAELMYFMGDPLLARLLERFVFCALAYPDFLRPFLDFSPLFFPFLFRVRGFLFCSGYTRHPEVIVAVVLGF